ncbi:lipopolysaccharide assembly protein LapA domain-containing protein [Rhodopirellula sp. JC639]|uniref:lipopolysaccharide assembly protein LapA domain-containing protein n=1 Tax=Stieleria mannarensis TaxID=2755585 RepID=UPI00160310E9|nr:LapA family protein [Rhodopirellula sp. JC639]
MLAFRARFLTAAVSHPGGWFGTLNALAIHWTFGTSRDMGNMARIRWFLIISGVLVLMIFSLSNTQRVLLRMPLVFHVEVPLAMLLAISGLIGFMVGALWTAWMLHRKKERLGKPDKKDGQDGGSVGGG